MTASWKARAMSCALGMGLVATSEEVLAREWDPPGEVSRPTSEPRSESVRVDLGIGVIHAMNGAAGLAPVATAALEGHLTGPAWLVVSASGGYEGAEDATGTTSSSTSFTLRAGPRFEWPVVDRFDAGFHAFAAGAFTHAELEGVDRVEEVDAIDLGGVAGASIHFRATRVFGVRVAIDALRGGWRRGSYPGGSGSAGYVRLSPSPAAELTFTF